MHEDDNLMKEFKNVNEVLKEFSRFIQEKKDKKTDDDDLIFLIKLLEYIQREDGGKSL